MENNSKSNKAIGQRLKECLKKANMTQVQLAEMTKYTKQHVNNIIRGERNMSIGAAKLFSDAIFKYTNGKINIYPEYLTGEVDVSTFNETLSENFYFSGLKEKSVKMILETHGYECVTDYWHNFELLSDDNQKQYFEHINNSCTTEAYYVALSNGAELAHEFVKPNGEHVYLSKDDYMDFVYDVLDYAIHRLERVMDYKNLACSLSYTEDEYRQKIQGDTILVAYKNELPLRVNVINTTRKITNERIDKCE